MIDFEKTRQEITPYIETLCERWLSAGKRNGRYWTVGSLTNEPGESLTVDLRNGIWKDYATGEKGGDLISLYAAIHRIEQADAARAILEQIGSGQIEQRPVSKAAERPDIPPVLVPPEREADPINYPKFGEPVAVWDYRTADGQIMFRVCRFIHNGRKENRPYSWNGTEWQWKAWPRPRPLYRLPELKANPKAPVLLVEGEKAADAAQRLLPGYVVTCWPFGAQAVKQAAWEPLKGRSVVMWPDNDEPGFSAARDVAEVLKGIAKGVRFVMPDPNWGKGWDLADAEGWDTARAMTEIKTRLSLSPPEPPKPEPVQDELPPVPEAAPPEPEQPPEPEPDDPDQSDAQQVDRASDNPFFRFMGYDRNGVFYYYSFRSGTLKCISATGHSVLNLTALADLQWWEQEFPGSRNGVNINAAANWCFRCSEKVGIYRPEWARGLGAWWDNGRCVVHLGERLIVDGKPMRLHEIASRYVYERAPAICRDLDLNDTLTDAESRQLVLLCEMLPWTDQNLYGRLYAGWLAVAPICGALRWRPHIWITGNKGSGKTWIFNNISVPVLGGFALAVSLSTTEAGIRAALKGDALAVLFEEAGDQAGKAGEERTRRMLELMRQSSSEGATRIIKGTADGGYQEYSIQSCFALQSVNIDMRFSADQSRVTVLNLADEKQRIDRFQDISKHVEQLLTPQYINRLHARLIGLIPTIRRNAEVFARAGATVLGSRRSGDQIGTLLAGSYALWSSGDISQDDAEKWITERREIISRESGGSTDADDERACLRTIMATRVQVEVDSGTRCERTLGELCAIGLKELSDPKIYAADAQRSLRRYGLCIKDGLVGISYTHPYLAGILKDTVWCSGWGRVLKRLGGATARAHTFGPGVTTHTVFLKRATIIGDEPETQPGLPLPAGTPVSDPADGHEYSE